MVNLPLVLATVIDPRKALRMCAAHSVEITIPHGARHCFVVVDNAVVAVEVFLVTEVSTTGDRRTQYSDLLSAFFRAKAFVQAPAHRWR